MFNPIVFLGTGTLGIPYAISQGGYCAIFAMVLVAFITNYTGKLIIECLYVKQKGVKRRIRQGYADLGTFGLYHVIRFWGGGRGRGGGGEGEGRGEERGREEEKAKRGKVVTVV